MRRFLIVRLSSLGDILHSSFLIENIKNNVPQAEIDWIVESRFEHIVRQFQGIHQVYSLPLDKENFSLKTIIGTIFSLRKKKYDVILDPQGLLKSGLLVKLSRSDQKLGFNCKEAREGSWLFYKDKIDVSGLTNIVDKNLALLKQLNFQVSSNASPRFRITLEAQGYVDEQLKNMGLTHCPIILVNPWAAYPTKKLPEDITLALLNRLKNLNDSVPVLMSGPKQWSMAKKTAKKAGVPLQFRTNLKQLPALIHRCSKYIGVDSGPSYLSGMLGKPTLILFGPTTAKRQAPPLPNLKWIYSDYDCPIIKSGEIKTPYRCLKKNCADPKCMKTYQVEKILIEF